MGQYRFFKKSLSRSLSRSSFKARHTQILGSESMNDFRDYVNKNSGSKPQLELRMDNSNTPQSKYSDSKTPK